MEKKTLKELIKQNGAIKELWEEYLKLYNYVDDKMVEGCDVAEKLLKEINKCIVICFNCHMELHGHAVHQIEV